MKKFLLFITVGILCTACQNSSPRCTEDFNFGWKFSLGDNQQWSEREFDDSGWRELHLPHDWSIEGEFSKDNPSTPGGGALPGGIGWYRKSFKTPAGISEKKVFLEFDGVFMNSTVFVNGKEMGTRPYGYSSFSYDITDVLNPYDSSNTVAVRCDNSDQPNSRWYAGCGIYRDVRMVTVSGTHVKYNGVYVTSRIDGTDADIRVEIEVEGSPDEVEVIVLNKEGKKVEDTDAVYSDGKWIAECDIDNPHPWDITDTYQYCAQIVLKEQNDKIIDSYRQRFGIRTAEWNPDKGFFLNGRQLKLLGVCLHHDQGCLGTAVHRRALERELGILKEMGCNAIRTSHNPPSPVLLELCDELGFLVIDEALDMWRKRKTTYDYSRFFDEWHEKDVQDFVRRDRNHPCIIAWSIGNEILEQWDSSEDDTKNIAEELKSLFVNFISKVKQKVSGEEDNPNILLTQHIVSLIRELDSRPVTAGCNETQPTNNLIRSGALDLYGFNYHVYDYDNIRKWYPDKALYGSETASSLESRGYYPQPSTDLQKQPEQWWMTYDTPHHQCTAYDALCAPWAEYHEQAWVAIRDRDYMAGTFVWTGFDYLGEPTPYSWPSRSSYFGIVDLAGFPKDIYWMYKSEWSGDTVLHLFPHWNWSDGDKVDVWCYYNNADEVELFLNGKSLGKSHKEGEQLRAQWLEIPWEAGCIEAVSYRDGKEVAREKRETTGEPVAIKLEADRSRLDSDGYDLCYVTVTAVDAEGREVPTASQMLNFKVEGCGELAGIDNGNAADTLCLKGFRKSLFNGKALGVIRSIKDKKGKTTLTVSAENSKLKSAEITVKCK